MADELKPLITLRRLAGEILADHGFTQLVFGVEPGDGDEAKPRVSIVASYDPEKEKLPDLFAVQIDEAMTEQLLKSKHEEQVAQADQARRELREARDAPDADLEKKLRGPGGFLS